MSTVEIDREMLETFSTSEIKRILREEYDDYTEEALEIFRDILEARGDEGRTRVSEAIPAGIKDQSLKNHFTSTLPINNPVEAVEFLNDLLSGVMNDRIDHAKADVGVKIVLALLKAHEAALMMHSDED